MSDGERPQPLKCTFCGVLVSEIDSDERCSLCAEVDARVESQLASAMVDYAVHAVAVALDYLHADDVRAIVEHGIEDRKKHGRDDHGRYGDLQERATRFILERYEREMRPKPGGGFGDIFDP
jgi:hypothetical protein